MTFLLSTTALTIAAVAALRSTWSPCGLSMLSTITPIGERGRRSNYRVTAAWFVVGAVLGGAMLGAVVAGLALGAGALGLSVEARGAAATAACLVAAASDARVAGFELPIHRRQVNERWLDTFRPWFYGLGFGWQIGCGVATYITTAAVYLAISLAVLSASLPVAFGAGALFGLVRGSNVLLGRRVTNASALRALHRRLHRFDSFARRAIVGFEVAAGLATLAVIWFLAAAVVGVTLLLGLAAAAFARRVPSASTSS